MTIKIQNLAQLVQGRLHGDGEVEVDSITLDSREVTASGIFAALPGTHTHGASFAADTPAAAILSDAAGIEILKNSPGFSRPVIEVEDIRRVLGIVAAEIYGHPTKDMTVIGITGTSGKTTTSYLVEAGLLAAGKSVGLIGTTGTRINRTPVATKLTTPEAPKLQELFATMRSKGVTHVVMEVSSHALALGRVKGTHFAAAGFTNLSQDHLDFHPTMEDYFQAKEALFDGDHHASSAVICVDDKWGKRMAAKAKSAGVETSTCAVSSPDEDIVATTLSVEPNGAQHVRLTKHGKVMEFRLPLPGPFNVANAALAIGLAEAVGVDEAAFVAGLENVAVPGRMERIDHGQDFIAVVDYAHKPAAIAAVLDTLKEQIAGGRVGIVLGAGGDRDSSKRAIMGENAARRADFVIVTDDNPRTEDPAAIRAQVLEGAHQAAREDGRGTTIQEVAHRGEAIDRLVAWAKPQDAVIVVGKGHEKGQIYGTEVHHFDDREELARALTNRGFSEPSGSK